MFIKSKLSVGVWVTKYAPLREGRTSLTAIKRVLIKGGANVQDKKTLIAPDGIIQEIPDADWEEIKDVEVVQTWIKNGFLIPCGSRKPKEDFRDMAEKDGSAQLTEKDYKKKGKKAPKAVREDDAEDVEL